MLENLLAGFKPIDLAQMRPVGFTEKEAVNIKSCVDAVDKKNGWVSIEKCPCCHSFKRKKLFERFSKDILQCEDCGLGYMAEFPKHLPDVVSDEEYLPSQQGSYISNVDYRKKRFGNERLNIIKKFSKRSPGETRLLDVGCGTGWFLEQALENGFNAEGLELGQDLAEYTSKRLGIKVNCCPLEELSGECYDVITLFDVIEHVPNPSQVMESIYSKLNPGGICLLFTPNLESLGFHLIKERSSLVMPAEHLFYFTQKSLAQIVNRAGLKVLDFSTHGMDIPDLIAHYRDDKAAPEVSAFLEENVDILQAVVDKSSMANHMRFVVSRPLS